MDFIGRPKMLKEAREQSKSHNIVIEILIFFAVFACVSIVESLILAVFGSIILFRNPAFIDTVNDAVAQILSGGDVDFGSVMSAVLANAPESYMIVTLFSTALAIAGVIIYCRFIEKRKVSTMGFRKKGFALEYLFGLLAGTLLFGFVMLFCCLMGAAKFTGISAKFSIGIVIAYFFGYMVQGMSEEVMFRGYLMVSASRRYHAAVGVTVSSVLFSLAHISNGGVTPLALINIALCGALFGLYILKRGNIWGAAAMHTAWNFAEGNLFGTGVSGLPVKNSVFAVEMSENMPLINGGSFGPEGGLGVTLAMLIGITIVIFMKSNKYETE